MLAQLHTWSTRNMSYEGKVILINNVIFGMVSYWASIFILSKEVLDRITQICRNFLWSGTFEFKRIPHIS